jgi:hypothetical protein
MRTRDAEGRVSLSLGEIFSRLGMEIVRENF